MRQSWLFGAEQRSSSVAVLISTGLHVLGLLLTLDLSERVVDADNGLASTAVQISLVSLAEPVAAEPVALEPKPTPTSTPKIRHSAAQPVSKPSRVSRSAVTAQAAIPVASVRETLASGISDSQTNDHADADTDTVSHSPAIASSADTTAHIAQHAADHSATAFTSVIASSVEVQKAQPDYAYSPQPDYPLLLRDQGIGGVVWLRVWVAPDGNAGDVSLLKSSGYRLLDESALRAVKSWRFIPARRGEQTLASWVEFPIRFSLQG